ncbi:Gigasin-6 [Pseudolycoriella hygida]|uniref:Gigasin-6 n=1 Tax=Pseudolycoriella hygida TaxID=35572 RepID=A0A9Q0S5F1_9DIPT|nr:Gigasin-6 [Pseudolycoriella hygida]
MKLKFFVVLIASSLLTEGLAFNAETELIIDELIENYFMRYNRIPGLGVSVVRNGTVLMSKGYGMKNVTAGLPSDGNTLFAIGSITKSFVAILVVRTLNELYPDRGSAILDIPLAELIPDTVNFTLSDRYRAEHTTFRDILTHRTCLSNGGVHLILGSLPSASEYAYRSRYLPEICEFRNGFEYNNHMLSLAGETIAAIAGTTLQDLVTDFANELGMENTTYVDFDGSYESSPDMSQPYVLRDDVLVEFDIFQIRKVHMALGAGGILSTANDMAKYMNFHLNLGLVDGRQIVPANVMNWLYTVGYPFDFRGGRTDEIGSIVYGDLGTAQGLFSTLYDGWNIIHHGGYWPPYHCDMRLFQATRIGVFICANGPGVIFNFPTHEITAYSIFELIRGSTKSIEQILSSKVNLGKPFVEHQFAYGHRTNRAPTVLHHKQIRTTVEPEDVLGVYGHPYDGDVTIRYDPETNNTALQVFFSDWAYGRLEQVPGFNTTFSIEWQTSFNDHFYSYPFPIPSFWVDFGVVDTALFRGGEFDLYDEFEYVKNATLDTFPPIPWPPTSCGPETLHH